MKQHIAKITSASYFQMRRLRQKGRRVGRDVTAKLVLALVVSRLDYCNAALPRTTLEPLRRVQNTAARLVFELGSREHVTLCLIELHCLPISWRIQFKMCTIMH
jgi:hypothetical protein